MTRLLPETQHLPIGVSQETFRTSRRWVLLAFVIATVAAVGVAAALLKT
ncbi:MAG TPA: hypothetical protein VGB51_09275 [Actinomycetota bacterium]